MRRIASTLAVLLVAASACLAGAHPPSAHAQAKSATFHATIAYAVDGDTLRIREPGGELAYVRLVGIDTPEDVKPGYPSECGSKAAARSMERLAPEGAGVTLRYDFVADHEDVYGRILAHAFIEGRRLELANCVGVGPTSTATTTSASTGSPASTRSRNRRARQAAGCGGDAAVTSTRPSRASRTERRRVRSAA
jgi:hypothetical protein